jgi:hypothetical protein
MGVRAQKEQEWFKSHLAGVVSLDITSGDLLEDKPKKAES